MNRAGRKLKAEETLRICEVGYYDLPDGVRYACKRCETEFKSA